MVWKSLILRARVSICFGQPRYCWHRVFGFDMTIVWHEIFTGVWFRGLLIFCVSREHFFANLHGFQTTLGRGFFSLASGERGWRPTQRAAKHNREHKPQPETAREIPLAPRVISDFTTGRNFREFLQVISLVFDVRNLYRATKDVVLSCLFCVGTCKNTERCDFVCYLGWEKQAVNYLLFGRRRSRLWF